jgi:hypothetical protein
MAEYTAVKRLTKKGYTEFEERLHGKYDDEETRDILKMFCDTFKFDPNISTYTKEMGKKMYQRRKQKSEETGVPLGVLSGQKAFNDRKKVSKQQNAII